MTQEEVVMNTDREQRASYPDGYFEYKGAISTRNARIAPTQHGDYAIFDSFPPAYICLGFASVEVLAPIIFAEWRK